MKPQKGTKGTKENRIKYIKKNFLSVPFVPFCG
jgi:hypothetical protein